MNTFEKTKIQSNACNAAVRAVIEKIYGEEAIEFLDKHYRPEGVDAIYEGVNLSSLFRTAWNSMSFLDTAPHADQ